MRDIEAQAINLGGSPTPHLPRDIPDYEMDRFVSYIAEHSGIAIEPEKRDTLRISLHARATKLNMPSYAAYYDLVTENELEFRELLSLVTINETYFFRYPEQFDVLRRFILPALRAEKERVGDRRLNIWSAGCSTGEEPISLAITVLEVFPDYGDWEIRVLGTDVSKKALQKAILGEYGKNSFRITNDEIRERYFTRVGGIWAVKREVRQITDYIFHNLIKEPYPFAFLEAWDIIFCRNVTIYFKPESTKRVVNNFFRSLVPGGYLFLGHSETLYNMNPGFDVVRFGDVFVYQKPASSVSARVGSVESAAVESQAIEAEPPAAPREDEARPATVERALEIDTGDVEYEVANMITRGRHEEAVAIAERAAAATGRLSPKLQLQKATALIELGRVAEASATIDELLQRDPLNAEGYYLKGLALRKTGELAKSLEAFKKAAYLDRDFGPALVEVGNVLCELGKSEQAVKYYQRAAETLRRPTARRVLDFGADEVGEFLAHTCEVMVQKLLANGGARKGGAGR